MKTCSKEPWNVNDKCGWFMLGKLNDKYHIIFFTNTMFNAAVLCTTSALQSLCFPKWNKKGKRCNKIKTSRPFWIAKLQIVAIFLFIWGHFRRVYWTQPQFLFKYYVMVKSFVYFYYLLKFQNLHLHILYVLVLGDMLFSSIITLW